MQTVGGMQLGNDAARGGYRLPGLRRSDHAPKAQGSCHRVMVVAAGDLRDGRGSPPVHHLDDVAGITA
ncbi:Uncharacterised protein [Mycobacterium tuberculosis]|nr:Uncharacterised protein [Mycobacterium tuberculosis]